MASGNSKTQWTPRRKKARAPGAAPLAQALVDLNFAKNAIGADLPTGAFVFGLYDDQGILIAQASNDADGLIHFVDVLVPDEGNYDFTIREISGPADWDLDTTAYDVHILANDNGQGGLNTTVVFSGTETIQFRNTHQSETCGLIEFPELTFLNEGDYEYTIREITQSGNGWETDGTTYPVIIHVVDDGHGNLLATATYPDGFPTFVDIFAGTFGHFSMSACKTCIGASAPDGRFEFGVFDEDGTLIAEASNDAIDEAPTTMRNELIQYAKQHQRACAGREIASSVVASNQRHAAPRRRRRTSCSMSQESAQRQLQKLKQRQTAC